jgi:hypothetical protein
MRSIRKLAACLLLPVSSTLLALLPVAVGAQNLQPAGSYRNSSMEAGFSAVATDGSFINVSIVDRTSVATPKVGPATSTHTSLVYLQDSFGFTCYLLPAGVFTFDSKLATASLTLTVDDTVATCDGQPGASPAPFTVNVTWTLNSPVFTQQSATHSACLDYRSEDSVTSLIAGASAVATLTPFLADPITTNTGNLRSTNETVHAHGTVHPSCPEEPGAEAGGAGPPDPGRYYTLSREANLNLSLASSSVFVSLVDKLQNSAPKTGPATSTHEMDIRIGAFGPDGGAFGCFVLTPADYSFNGVQSAQVNVVLTEATLTCDGNPSSLQLPQTVNLAWTDTTAPVSTFRIRGGFRCLTYHVSGLDVISIDDPEISVSITPLISEPIASSFAVILSNEQRTHAEGKKQPACRI